jgi:hypothetical protein
MMKKFITILTLVILAMSMLVAPVLASDPRVGPETNMVDPSNGINPFGGEGVGVDFGNSQFNAPVEITTDERIEKLAWAYESHVENFNKYLSGYEAAYCSEDSVLIEKYTADFTKLRGKAKSQEMTAYVYYYDENTNGNEELALEFLSYSEKFEELVADIDDVLEGSVAVACEEPIDYNAILDQLEEDYYGYQEIIENSEIELIEAYCAEDQEQVETIRFGLFVVAFATYADSYAAAEIAAELELQGNAILAGEFKEAEAAFYELAEQTSELLNRDFSDLECPADPPVEEDSDNDGIVDSEDNCPTDANADQADADADGIGDVCDDTDNTPKTDRQLYEEYQADYENYYDDYKYYKGKYRDAIEDDDEDDIEDYENDLEDLDDDLKSLDNKIEDLIDDVENENDVDDDLVHDLEELEEDVEKVREKIDDLLKEADEDNSQSSNVVIPVASNTNNAQPSVVIETLEVPNLNQAQEVDTTSNWGGVREAAWLIAGIVVLIGVILFLLALLLTKK